MFCGSFLDLQGRWVILLLSTQMTEQVYHLYWTFLDVFFIAAIVAEIALGKCCNMDLLPVI